jgi:hypothetical protein
MNMRIGNAVRLGVLAAALVAAGGFAAAAPASAAVSSRPGAAAGPHDGPYPPAYNTFNIPLTGKPKAGMATVCSWQTIYLTAGEYGWVIIIGGTTNVISAVDIPLDSSNYFWKDCIIPKNGYYQESSELCPLDLPAGYPCVTRYAYYYHPNSDIYRVGSELDWLYL